MLFSSITFLYFFLPLTIFLYFLVPQKGRNFVLFIMSIVFYAWGEPVYVFLMLAQIVISYVLVVNMDRIGRIGHIISVLLPFMALFYFKYFNFFTEMAFGVKTKPIALPIGISFYTFQIVSYCVDVYRGRVRCQKNFITYAAYVTLFPQLVAGPIVRYSEIEGTLAGGMDLSKAYDKFRRGIVRFSIGLGKKVLIANVLGEFVTEVAALGQRNVSLSWAYAAAASLQLYFDFSGYSDMAIGLGSILGFDFPENFKYPFIARSVSEFWRRWHITLGLWFRDYVYIPMGGNRVSMVRWILNILVVWLFTGLWHGAGWNFIVWGLFFAVFLVFEKYIKKLCGDSLKIPKPLSGFGSHVYMVLIVVISFLIFHNDSLAGAFSDIQSLFGCGAYIAHGAKDTDVLVWGYLLRNTIVILVIALIGSTPVPMLAWTWVCQRIDEYRAGERAVYILKGTFTAVLLVLCTAYLIDGSFNPFLYFRF